VKRPVKTWVVRVEKRGELPLYLPPGLDDALAFKPSKAYRSRTLASAWRAARWFHDRYPDARVFRVVARERNLYAADPYAVPPPVDAAARVRQLRFWFEDCYQRGVPATGRFPASWVKACLDVAKGGAS
jgi:hypothetical protein